MIRIRFVYDNQELLKMPKDSKLLPYNKEDFYHLVQGYTWEEDKKPPCRDEDSVRFIREIDRAEFVEGDWYSVVTPFNRTDMTALCGGTKYALTVINNSRSGFYTSYVGYEKDIWGRLADLSIDVLIYICTSDLNSCYCELPFPLEIEEKIVIENYRHNGEETEAYLRSHSDQKRGMIDGKLYIENYFPEFCFDLYRDFGMLIKKAGNLLKWEKKLLKRPPFVMSVKEFAETLEERYREYLCSYLDGTDSWVSNYEDVNRFLKNLVIHNYLYYVPGATITKYPICIVIRKNRHTGECTIKQECGYKHPDIACILVEDFLRLSDEELPDYEKMTVVIDSELFWRGAEELDQAIWAFKLYDNVAELYDGRMIYKVFLDFVKQPFEDGLVRAYGEKEGEK